MVGISSIEVIEVIEVFISKSATYIVLVNREANYLRIKIKAEDEPQ